MPELQHGEVVHAEHLVRYRLAAQLAGSRRVLDAACGEGYGTGLLAAAGAREAVGIDIDEAHHRPRPDAVPGRRVSCRATSAGCRSRTAHSIWWCRSRPSSTSPNPSACSDELRRVLAQDGLLLISTPNKHQYLVENEFHEREFLHEEFVGAARGALSPASRFCSSTTGWPRQPCCRQARRLMRPGASRWRPDSRSSTGVEPGGELYTVALCGDGGAPLAAHRGGRRRAGRGTRAGATPVAAEQSAEKWHEEYQRARRLPQDGTTTTSGQRQPSWPSTTRSGGD